ncbi:DUF4339 domain-containing protein [bacterium]|nr:MAG: DUF4339 domain-containing protein [bacterium]
MKKYFYSDGTTKVGPFTLEELKERRISRETLVWFQELGDWKPAGSIPEISEIFMLTPPPFPRIKVHTLEDEHLSNQSPPKTWLLESILATLFCCLPLGIVGIVNAAKVETRFYAGDLDGANRLSADAKRYTTISFWIGLSVGIIYLIVIIVGAASV